MRHFRFTGTFVLILLFVLPLLCFSQKNLNKADSYFNSLAYAEAIPLYLNVLKSDSTNFTAMTHLAECYSKTNNLVETERWYSRIVRQKEAGPIHIFNYVQALMSNGKYPEAQVWIEKYKAAGGKDERADRILESLHNVNALLEDSAGYNIHKLSINSPKSDFGPVVYNHGIVFTSSRERKKPIHRTHEWTDLPFYSVYFAKGQGMDFSEPEYFAPEISTPDNNGPVCFNKAGDELYMTSNKEYDLDDKQTTVTYQTEKLFHYKKSGLGWTDETPFPYNSNHYHCAHPCLSPDGNRLYFTSDMPGGYGGLDLYVCTKNGDGWGKPVNLGPSINTAGSDAYPFLDVRGGLFFSSNGLGGLGGYDIFYCASKGDGFTTPVNLGYPINSSGDDISWVNDEDGTNGYFASNREEKNLNDDIYYFKRMAVLLNILVYDVRTSLPAQGVSIKVFADGVQKKVITTNDSGQVSLLLTPGKKYRFETEDANYMTDTAVVDAGTLPPGSAQHLSMARKRKPHNYDLSGKVLADDDSMTVDGAQVLLLNKGSGTERSTITPIDGTYEFRSLSLDSLYRLEVKMKDCIATPVDISMDISPNDQSSIIARDIMINCVGRTVKIENIYYDLNKYNIRPDAAMELDKLVFLMKSNPGMRIELNSYTDCRNTRAYNQRLSDQRARAAVNYLAKQGISRSRLIAIGYGESKPVNHCECEGNQVVPCSEEEHQANRRTEFKILSLKEKK